MVYIILLVPLLAILYLIAVYNHLVTLKYRLKEAWSGVDVQLKRRFDLIISLVETVKGYAGYEKGLLEKVTDLRSRAGADLSVKEKSGAENGASQLLKSLFAVVEAYPDLKANQGYLDLQKNITEAEDQIQYARRYYNGTVRDFNIVIESFPSSIIAGIFKFTGEDFFEIELVTQRDTPEIKL